MGRGAGWAGGDVTCLELLADGWTTFLQCWVTAAVCSTTVAHGCVVGFPAVLLPQLRAPATHVPLSDDAGSWIASVTALTLVAGCAGAAPAMGRLGRRAAHVLVIGTILLGWLVIAFAQSVECIMAGRVIHGVSFGLMLPLRSVLLGEYTSPRRRGAFLTALAAAQAAGILLVHLLGSLLPWHTTCLVVLAFPSASLLITYYTPESPSWLAAKGRYEECREAFRWLRGDDEEPELEEMIKARVNERDKKKVSNLRDVAVIVQKKEFYKPIVIMVHSYLMGEFSGGALMSCYSTTVIALVAGPAADARLWMIALDVQRNVSNLLAVFVVNKLRRRTMMLTTGSICILSTTAIAAYVYAKVLGVMTYTAIWLPILLINIQFFSVAVGMVCLPYVIAGEIFPLEYRSLAGSISIVSIACGFFAVTKTFPALVGVIGLHGSYAVYAAVMTYSLVVIWAMLPETRGKTLQQIEDEFRGKPSLPEEREVRELLKGKSDIEKCAE